MAVTTSMTKRGVVAKPTEFHEKLTRGREAHTNEYLEKIDSGDHIAMNVRDASWFGAESYTGNIPFWCVDLNAVKPPDATDPDAEPLVIADLGKARFKLSKRAAPMPYTWRSTVCDEMHFIHRGRVRFLTELGEIEGIPGRFVNIGQGVRYRMIPEGPDLFDFILESRIPLRGSEHWKHFELDFIRPTVASSDTPSRTGQMWEERIAGLDWSARVKRSYDPLRVKEVVGPHDLAFGLDFAKLPKIVPGTHRPFRLFENEILELDISKHGDGEGPPFNHRNNVRNEFQFVHNGDADQATELGYIDAPAGTFYCMPFGIEHSFGKRDTPPEALLFETKGPVKLQDGLS